MNEIRMIKKDKFFTTYYFQHFTIINAGVLLVVLASSLLVKLNTFAILLYIVMLMGFAVFAKINFELGRVWGGLGGTMFMLLLGRSLLGIGLRTRVGIFKQLPTADLEHWYRILISDWTSAIFAFIGCLGIFFLILDIFVAVKYINLSTTNTKK